MTANASKSNMQQVPLRSRVGKQVACDAERIQGSLLEFIFYP
jgi:hypothetical protein